MSIRPIINSEVLNVKHEDNVSPLAQKLVKDADPKKKNSTKSLKTIKRTARTQSQICTTTAKTCLKSLLANRIWMVSLNMYDIMGLLDICPCGTLHSVRPYISYKIK
ncbi:hypothetical protein RN001_003126 [Aquatica leii]|uniref:Uncharacterized protein n=1 Tax=Aquatica leii TaxID=1421715 RepID=A0AAN7PEI0_9COLE|nr:hypothetical protein RN001_003126 [Aquatica leii]